MDDSMKTNNIYRKSQTVDYIEEQRDKIKDIDPMEVKDKIDKKEEIIKKEEIEENDKIEEKDNAELDSNKQIHMLSNIKDIQAIIPDEIKQHKYEVEQQKNKIEDILNEIEEQKDIIKPRSNFARIATRFCKHKLAVVSLIFFLIMTLLAIFAPLIAPYDPNVVSGGFSKAPSIEHWLGTDQIGRDMLSRLLYAMRVSLFVGAAATVVSTIIGTILGLISGYVGGFVDSVIMRFTDMVMSFPYILLVLVAAVIFEPGVISIVLILGFVDWPGVARLVRGNVLSLRETAYIKADIVAGMPRRYMLFSEILPNTIAPVLVYATQVFAISILDEAALSFLGMGVQPPTASLGNILNGAESITILTSKFWLWMPAGAIIILLVISINFIGDAFRDALDPSAN